MIWSWIWPLNYAALALLALAAWRWGAGPERASIATLALMNLGDRGYHALVGRGAIYASVDIGHLVIDLIIAAIFVVIALHANRLYPLWIAALQLLSVVSHVARHTNDELTSAAYALMTYLPYYCSLAILGIGIWYHARRWRRHGPYRSWRLGSHAS